MSVASVEKCIIAGSSPGHSVSETYVPVQNLQTYIQQKIVPNEPGCTEMRVIGFQISEEDMQAVAYGLTESKILKALSLDHLQISDSGAKQLAQGLCYNESLTFLSLRWNEIGNEGGAALADALHYNNTIKHMILSFNSFGKAAGLAFANAIRKNTSLETLDLKWNNIDDEAGDSLLEAMSENKGSLATLLLGGNGSSLRNTRKNNLATGKSANRYKSMRFLSRKDKKVEDTTVSLDQLRKDLTHVLEENDEEEEVVEAHELEVGDRVETRGGPGVPVRKGRVRFVGETQFSTGVWIGIEFDGPHGKNNGTVEGVQYFSCAPNRGSFLRPEKLTYIPE